MGAIRQADTRRPASTRESASRDVDELAWPPSIDDLDAIDVVPMAAYATELKDSSPAARVLPSLPPLPQPRARQHATSQTPALPSLPDLFVVHDLADGDADTFRSEASRYSEVEASARHPRPVVARGRSRTRLVLYAAASVAFLVMTMYPRVWVPAESPGLPYVTEVASTSPIAAPMAPVREAAVETPLEAEPLASVPPGAVERRRIDGDEPASATPTVAVAPAVSAPAVQVSAPSPPAVPAPATPREPVQFVSPPESQRVLEPESQRVLQPDGRSAQAIETMARADVPVAVPPRPLPTEVAASPSAAPRDDVNAAPAAVAAPTRTVPVPERTDEVGVQAALQRYELAYSRLDARAAQAVWPSVDARALARAFESLESQSLQIDRCELDVRETVAKADCSGTATYVRRIGSRAPRTEPRAWTFNLRKTGDAWQILNAAAR